MPMPAYMPGCEFHKRVNDKYCSCKAHRVYKAKSMAVELVAFASHIERAAIGEPNSISRVKHRIDDYWHGLVFFECEIESILPPE